VIERHATLFDAVYPARTREVREWIRSPNGDIAGILFLPAKRDVHGGRLAGGPHRVDRARASTSPLSGKRPTLD
jgi:hypothetical protein